MLTTRMSIGDNGIVRQERSYLCERGRSIKNICEQQKPREYRVCVSVCVCVCVCLCVCGQSVATVRAANSKGCDEDVDCHDDEDQAGGHGFHRAQPPLLLFIIQVPTDCGQNQGIY